jgi:hypothetical protein
MQVPGHGYTQQRQMILKCSKPAAKQQQTRGKTVAKPLLNCGKTEAKPQQNRMVAKDN